MKAPKKIYLQKNTTTDLYGEIWPEWFESRTQDADIEYTRTDAFIKKACKWLQEHSGDYLLYPFCEFDIGELVKDFKKAMEE